MLMDNPIQVWMRWFKYASATIHLQLLVIWRFVGAFLTFLVLNLFALIYLRVADVLVHIWKFMRAIFRLPLSVLVRRIIFGFHKFLVSLPKAERNRRKRAVLQMRMLSTSLVTSSLKSCVKGLQNSMRI